ncbi:hypothetical protein FBU30_007852 [Linnemannia zychae]|nr:hypothetical protein FBU30_007852 [Linnemannia zychae]
MAENAIKVNNASATQLQVEYSCDLNPTSEVVAIKAMVGREDSDNPSATGSQNFVTCDGSVHESTITLENVDGSPPISQGENVQVRVALVDATDTVISGITILVAVA